MTLGTSTTLQNSPMLRSGLPTQIGLHVFKLLFSFFFCSLKREKEHEVEWVGGKNIIKIYYAKFSKDELKNKNMHELSKKKKNQIACEYVSAKSLKIYG